MRRKHKNLYAFRSMPFYLFLGLCCLCAPALWAEDAPAAQSAATPGGAGGKDDFLVLKMMIVNPSDKHEQVYPMKAYLPEEVQQEHVLEMGDLELGFDPDKSAHYVHRDITLQPGESVIKSIKIRDVWFIPDPDMEKLAEEARDLYKKLANTKYSKQGRLLLTNVETLLLQIQQSQHDNTLTPDEHIALYKNNKRKLDDIEMDVMAMRRFVVSTGGSSAGSILPFGDGGSGKSAQTVPGLEVPGSGTDAGSGTLPAWVLWRIIFAVVGFTGMMSLLFFGFWQHQLRVAESKRKQMLDHDKGKRSRSVRLGDFLGPESEPQPAKGKGKAA